MKYLYVALMWPHLEYDNVIWHPFLQKDIYLLEKVQQRATKMIPAIRHISYEDRLRAMDLPSLLYRRLRGEAVEAYKYLHSCYRVDNSFLPLHQAHSEVCTRGHCLKLQKRDCRTTVRANFFSFRIVNFCNALPTNVVEADTVNCFKGRFDKHCSHLCFCTDMDDLWKTT